MRRDLIRFTFILIKLLKHHEVGETTYYKKPKYY